MIKYFQLRTNEDHFIEFQVGLDSFKFDFIWNDYVNKWAINIYKNFLPQVLGYFIGWSINDVLLPFKYKRLGSLTILSEEKELIETTNRLSYVDLNKENITNFIFKWEYNYGDI